MIPPVSNAAPGALAASANRTNDAGKTQFDTLGLGALIYFFWAHRWVDPYFLELKSLF